MHASPSLLQSLTKSLQLKLFLSNRYVYAQILRLEDGNILAAASTIEKGIREGVSGSTVDKAACSRVGELLAERANAVGVQNVHWERKRGQRYHGRIAALLSSMQQSGLKLV